MQIPLALIHGWGQHGGAWRELLAHLETAEVLNLELPGHGAAAPGPFDLDAMADAYADAVPASCALVAWSLGGLIALRWAQRRPNQVKKLVLISATPCFGERADWPHGSPQAVQQAFAAQVAADPARALPRFADLMAEGEIDLRGARKALRGLGSQRPLPETDALLAGLVFLADTDLRAEVRAAPPQQAALVIHGEGDTITPSAAGLWLAETLPNARWLPLPGCGHAPAITHAAATAAAIKKFLDE